MRVVLIAIVVTLIALPAFAKREPRRRECYRLTSQIARYEGDVERARERGNELWEKATLQQIERLSERRERRCPQYAEDDEAAALREMGRFLGTAAKLAVQYFTKGF